VSTLVVLEYVSLDGVIQAPGHAGEDPSGGFAHGGWSGPFISQHPHFVAESFAAADGFLFGRLTDPGDPVARTLNTVPKYVASASPLEPAWAGTTVLFGDGAEPTPMRLLEARVGTGGLVLLTYAVAFPRPRRTRSEG